MLTWSAATTLSSDRLESQRIIDDCCSQTCVYIPSLTPLMTRRTFLHFHLLRIQNLDGESLCLLCFGMVLVRVYPIRRITEKIGRIGMNAKKETN